MTEFPERVRHIQVSSFNQPVGTLDQPGQYRFQYKGEPSVWCSLTMPPRANAYQYGALHPIFAQNLPEGYVRRFISERLARYARVNDIYLLALQHENGIGHLSVQSEIQPAKSDPVKLDDILSWEEREPIFHYLLEKYYLVGMLSGIQPKVMVPAETAESGTLVRKDLIIKTFDEEHNLLTLNEFVCMSAARHAGLNPPCTWLSEDRRSFVIERFDKINGQRMGFEDFTVLTGQEKYRGSYETLLKAVSDYTRTQNQVIATYRLIVFNCLIGNGDAHLKNFALQYTPDRSKIWLSPPYDITHTLIYPTVDNDMALKLEGAKSFPDRKALIKLGQNSGIRQADEIIGEIADLLTEFINQCDLIDEIQGFRQSLIKALDLGSTRAPLAKKRRNRHKKYP